MCRYVNEATERWISYAPQPTNPFGTIIVVRSMPALTELAMDPSRSHRQSKVGPLPEVDERTTSVPPTQGRPPKKMDKTEIGSSRTEIEE